MGKIVIVPRADDQVRAVPSKTPNNILQANATYVIIGGTGGLGRSMSRWMIEKGARNIVLLSRSGKSDGKVGELIEEAAAIGASIIVKACDVSNKESVEKLVSQDCSTLPPIRGLIHAAMVLDVSLPRLSCVSLLTMLSGRSLRENAI